MNTSGTTFLRLTTLSLMLLSNVEWWHGRSCSVWVWFFSQLHSMLSSRRIWIQIRFHYLFDPKAKVRVCLCEARLGFSVAITLYHHIRPVRTMKGQLFLFPSGSRKISMAHQKSLSEEPTIKKKGHWRIWMWGQSWHTHLKKKKKSSETLFLFWIETFWI